MARRSGYRTRITSPTADAAANTQLQALQDALNTKQDRDAYAQSRGYQDWEVMKEAVSEAEKVATNTRLLNQAEKTNQASLLKDIAATSVGMVGGQQYGTAAMNALMNRAGLPVPAAPVDQKQAALNKIKAAKTGQPTVPETAPTETAPTPTAPTFAPATPTIGPGIVQAQNQGSEVNYLPVYPPARHLSTGGEDITNAPGPWEPGGLFYGNPTNVAATNVREREAAMYPFGPVSPGSQVLYGGSPFDTRRLVAPTATPAQPTPAPAQPTATPPTARNAAAGRQFGPSPGELGTGTGLGLLSPYIAAALEARGPMNFAGFGGGGSQLPSSPTATPIAGQAPPVPPAGVVPGTGLNPVGQALSGMYDWLKRSRPPAGTF